MISSTSSDLPSSKAQEAPCFDLADLVIGPAPTARADFAEPQFRAEEINIELRSSSPLLRNADYSEQLSPLAAVREEGRHLPELEGSFRRFGSQACLPPGRQQAGQNQARMSSSEGFNIYYQSEDSLPANLDGVEPANKRTTLHIQNPLPVATSAADSSTNRAELRASQFPPVGRKRILKIQERIRRSLQSDFLWPEQPALPRSRPRSSLGSKRPSPDAGFEPEEASVSMRTRRRLEGVHHSAQKSNKIRITAWAEENFEKIESLAEQLPLSSVKKRGRLRNNMSSIRARIKQRLIHLEFLRQNELKDAKMRVVLEGINTIFGPEVAVPLIEEARSQWRVIDEAEERRSAAVKIIQEGLLINGKLHNRSLDIGRSLENKQVQVDNFSTSPAVMEYLRSTLYR